jgi:hypothetical protein
LGQYWRSSPLVFSVEYMEPEPHRVIDGIIDRGRGELMSDLALRYPVSVVHHIRGLPEEQLEMLQNLAVGLLLYLTRPDIAVLCSQRLGSMLEKHIEERRRTRANDFIGTLRRSAAAQSSRTWIACAGQAAIASATSSSVGEPLTTATSESSNSKNCGA